MNNSRWSVKQPTPLLGDHKTPIQQVDKFYAFWERFESWREFEDDDAHDIEQAGCREEKRWMERENEREKKKLKKKENNRLNRLVENAYKTDPRVVLAKAVEKAKKEQGKKAKVDARKAREDEAAAKKKAKDDEKAAAEAVVAAEKEVAKKNAKRQKDLLRNAKRRVKKLCEANTLILEAEGDGLDAIERVCSALSIQELGARTQRTAAARPFHLQLSGRPFFFVSPPHSSHPWQSTYDQYRIDSIREKPLQRIDANTSNLLADDCPAQPCPALPIL